MATPKNEMRQPLVEPNGDITDYGSNNNHLRDSPPLVRARKTSFLSGRRASFWVSVFNLMNAILGSGILGLTFAMSHSGIVVFSILLLFMAVVADFSIKLLLTLCDRNNLETYEDCGRLSYGEKGFYAASASIAVQNLGAMTSYMVIIGDLLPQFVATLGGDPDAWWADRKFLMITVAVCVIYPLALLRRMGVLGYSSLLSITMMVMFTIVVVAKQHKIPCPILPEDVCTLKYFALSTNTAFAFPTIAFSFVCHTTLLPVYTELSYRTQSRMQNVSRVSIFFTWLMYFLVALFGYFSFKAQTKSDLMLNFLAFDPNDRMIQVVQACFILAVILTVPLICFPLRKTVALSLVGKKFISTFKHWAITTVALGSVLALAIFVPNVKNVFGVVGATSSVSLVFFLPPLFYLKTTKDIKAPGTRAFCMFLMILGGFIFVATFAALFYQWLK